jgi:hypothetical protein
LQTRSFFEDAVHNFIHLILLLLLSLKISQHKGTQLFSGIKDILLGGYLSSQQFLDLVGNAFANLIIFVNVFIVIHQFLIAFTDEIVSLL